MRLTKDVISFLQAAKSTEEMDFFLEWYSIRFEWDLWAGKAKLLADEAIPLMNGIDPRSWQEYLNDEKGFPVELVQSIQRCLELAKHEELAACTPPEWLTWGRVHGLDKPILRSQDWIPQPDMCMWPLFESAVNKAKIDHAQETKNIVIISPDHDEEIANLFDPVSHKVLSTIFPSKNKKGNDYWPQWHRKAKQFGLDSARQGWGMYNPYRAAKWWIDTYKPEGWDLARCLRVIANKCLPVRSIDSKELLTYHETDK